MQQAPEYREQDQPRREYIPPQPPPAYQGQPVSGASAAGARQQVGPLAWSDWVRWGPIWSGFFAIVSTLVVLGALGSGIGWSVWHGGIPAAFAIGWSIFTGIIAYLLGGWVTARSAGVSGVGAAILNSALAWALSLIAFLVVAIVGAGNVFGTRIGVMTTAGSTGGAATAAWTTFATLVIGLILAIIGGLVGAHLPALRRQRAF
jgi:hypothetical protein